VPQLELQPEQLRPQPVPPVAQATMMKKTTLQRARYEVLLPEQQLVRRRRPLLPAVQVARVTKLTSRAREKTIQPTNKECAK
jgi:hypothetical protein